MKILGISAYYHDSAAALVENGKVIAAAQEERFSRIKHDESFPIEAIRYCLNSSGINLSELDAVVFYDKPFLKFERLVQSYLDFVPAGWWQFIKAMPDWLKQKLFIKSQIKEELQELGEINWDNTSLLFSKHHLSHAASSFFVSPFEEAAVLTIDGVGEWATASIYKGSRSSLEVKSELHFPNSLGLYYSAFTYFLGFKVNSGEYKLMGLAPYADDDASEVLEFKKLILNEIVKVFDDGSIELNQKYFRFATSFKMINDGKFEQLFGFKRREEESEILSQHYNLAKAVQLVLEEVVIKMAEHAKALCQSDNLCLAGGVALNCVANGRLEELDLFSNIYVQPASGDAGNALGAALAAYHMHYKQDRRICTKEFDGMSGALLGPEYTETEIARSLEKQDLTFDLFGEDELIDFAADQLNKGANIAWFQGKMEFGPRALGARSILGNPLSPETQAKLNLKVKKRESFRPFAPIMLQGEFTRLFGRDKPSPYMLFVHKIKREYRKPNSVSSEKLSDKISAVRSVLPAISHMDYSSRIQTVSSTSNKRLFLLLNKMKQLNGFGVLVNTSFNLRGEPIVCSPDDAIASFLSTELDFLVIGNFVIAREKNLNLFKEQVSIKLD